MVACFVPVCGAAGCSGWNIGCEALTAVGPVGVSTTTTRPLLSFSRVGVLGGGESCLMGSGVVGVGTEEDGTLLGPEGSCAARGVVCGGLCGWGWPWPVYPSPAEGVRASFVGGVWCWWFRLVAGRVLRTEQWTRASYLCVSFVAQVFKGARWMPWYQEPKKDVGICDKPRGVDNQTVIRGFPNGETRLEVKSSHSLLNI